MEKIEKGNKKGKGGREKRGGSSLAQEYRVIFYTAQLSYKIRIRLHYIILSLLYNSL